MNTSQTVIKLILDAMGQRLELDRFEKRLLAQKKIYLLQLTGLDLGYRFRWYLRGPYCSELTRDLFGAKEQIRLGDDSYKQEELTTTARRHVVRATRIWEDRPAGIEESEWVELLASLHYLKHIAYWPKGTPSDFDAIFKGLMESKPQFTRRKAEARKAWQRLEGRGLLQNKTLLPA